MGSHDLTALVDVTEDSVLRLLQERFQEKKIYTGLGGNVVVKVNPFESVPADQPEERERLVTQGRPHIALLARKARTRAIQTGRSQSCMMTGESGSGKTEATKVYLNELASSEFCQNASLHTQLVESCALLESFGNCATEHNHNSSRFARWFELEMSRKSGKIYSGTVVQYLLEKSRVVKGSACSSNFHVLYDICTSFSGDTDPSSVQQPADYFAYLQGRKNTGDNARWCRMLGQLDDFGLSKEQAEELQNVLWCVLHLGNLDFEDAPGGGCTVSDASIHALRCVSLLLKIPDVDTVASLFQTKTLEIANEIVQQQRSAAQARESRDALAKEAYSRLFRWLVTRMNKSISTNHQASGSDGDGAAGTSEQLARITSGRTMPAAEGGGADSVSVGLLDIFGFERFDKNGFEQLCINYCNEKLVQQFHAVLVQAEVTVCKAEGVPETQVGVAGAYVEEQERKRFLLNGIDQIFRIIQDQSRVKSTDANVVSKVLPLKLGAPTKRSRMSGTLFFPVEHYAGPVEYDATGFLAINKDEGPKDIYQVLLSQSSSSFVKELFQLSSEVPTPPPSPVPPGSGPLAREQHRPQGAARAAAKKKTLGLQFRDEFSELAANLAASEQQFVMCVKPNRQAVAGDFSEELVLKQLECNGLLSVCSVRKGAFAAHIPHADFVRQYRSIAMVPSSSSPSSNDAETAKALLDDFTQRGVFGQNDVFMGKTRVLLRDAARNALSAHLERVSQHVAGIQALVRGFVARNKFRREMQRRSAACIVVQAAVRMRLAREAFRIRLTQHRLYVRDKAATTIQACMRARLATRFVRRIRQALAEKRATEEKERLAREAEMAALLEQERQREEEKKRQEEEEKKRQAQLEREREEKERKNAQAKRVAAASAGLAAVLAAGAAGASAAGPRAPGGRSSAPSGQSTATSASQLDNSTVLRRPLIPSKRRRRPSKPTPPLVTENASVQAVAGAAAARACEYRPPTSSSSMSFSHPPTQTISRTLSKTASTPVMPVHSEMYAEKSASFRKRYGQTEEKYYEGVARSLPRYKYLIPELQRREKNRDIPSNPASPQNNAHVRSVLDAAISKRDMKTLSAALKTAYDADYHGPKVLQAEAVVAFIRKVHIKQLEAEQALAEKFEHFVEL